MKILCSNRGSSSILVSMVLLILVVFSVLAVTTSVAGLKLSRKNADTIAMYYSLDSAGERFLHEIRSKVKEAGDKAEEAISAIRGNNYDNVGLPGEIRDVVREACADFNSPEGLDEYLDELYPKLVIYYAQESIEAQYTRSVGDKAWDYAGDPAIYGPGSIELSFSVKRTFILEHEGNHRYLNVTLEVSNPERGARLDRICSVKEWRLWQEPFEYKNEIDLWEGIP